MESTLLIHYLIGKWSSECYVILRQTLAVNVLFIIVINSCNARRVKIVKNLHSYNYATAVVVRNGGYMFVVKGSLFRKLESQ